MSVEIMAQLLRANNYNIKPVLSMLLKSVMFHEDEIRGAKIKSPTDLMVGAMRQFNVDTPDFVYMRQVADQLRQTLFSPPNVSGWDGDKVWIDTTSLPSRNIFTDAVVNGEKSNGSDLSFEINFIEFVRTFPSSEDAVQLIDDLSKIFLQFTLSENRKQYLLDTLLDGAEVYDWSTSDPLAEDRLKLFFKALMRLSEYQLS